MYPWSPLTFIVQDYSYVVVALQHVHAVSSLAVLSAASCQDIYAMNQLHFCSSCNYSSKLHMGVVELNVSDYHDAQLQH